MRDNIFNPFVPEWVQIGLYTVSLVNHALDNFDTVRTLGIYKYTFFETLKALSRGGNDFRIWMI